MFTVPGLPEYPVSIPFQVFLSESYIILILFSADDLLVVAATLGLGEIATKL